MTSMTLGLVGSGGDGVVVLGSLLQKIAALQGYFSQMPRYYGAQIRGGGSAVKLSLDAERPSPPKDNLDILVCFDWAKYLEFEQELPVAPNTLVLAEAAPPSETPMPSRFFLAGFAHKSQELTASPLDKNIVALGLLDRILNFPSDRVNRSIAEDKDLAFLRERVRLLDAGAQLFIELTLSEWNLSVPSAVSPKVVLHGSSAMARAAIHAGCRAFFGYPITPASEIMQEMQEQLPQRDGICLQAEDEIAAVGMTIGASLTGVKSLTATSGPGLDLMTEFLGLASMAEIPLVIIDVQRCGPATGIPSKSEQSDLDHALYGGHGDTTRVVIAPFDLEGCYRLTIEAVNISESLQTPVIVLSDQLLGQTLVSTSDEFLRKDYPILERVSPATGDAGNYRRYRVTPDYVSPIAAVGDEGLIYQATGLTHTETGAPATDFATHQAMHEKRRNKLEPLRRRDDLVRVFGKEDAGRGIITWGSSAQMVLETVRELGLEEEIKVCVPELLCPLPDSVSKVLQSVERLLVVEMNFSAQLYHYLRSRARLPEQTSVYSRAGGLPFSRSELAVPVKELLL